MNVTGGIIGFTFLSEFMGSLLLILIGNGVVALVSLKGSKGFKTGWSAIAIGWGLAVFIGAMVASFTNAHLNFAASMAVLIQSLAGIDNEFTGREILILIFLAAQFSGMFVGQLIVDLVYWLQMEKETDKAVLLGMHSTSPAQKERTGKTYTINFITEFVATFVLILAVSAVNFYSGTKATENQIVEIAKNTLPGAFIAALVVMGIGYGLGGPTGFAINPTRDFAPRLVHAILPIKNKGTSDWSYSWLPVLAPLLGGIAAGGMVLVFHL